RHCGRQGADLLLSPRKTGRETRDKWLVAGRAAAISAGAYSLSSNSSGGAAGFGGFGWVVDPDGEVLATTSPDPPFATLELDLGPARRAKGPSPRNVAG